MALKKANKIGLFGGSFSPPHQGHWAVLNELCQNPNFDEIWLVPVFKHAFGKDLLDFTVRLELLNLLIQGFAPEKIKINTVERNLGKTPNYTFDTITHLKKIHPQFAFTVIVGSDAKNDLPRWHRYAELKKIANFYFIARKGWVNPPDEKSTLPEVSSSEIRERLKKGQDISGLTTPEIQAYLIKHKVFTA